MALDASNVPQIPVDIRPLMQNADDLDCPIRGNDIEDQMRAHTAAAIASSHAICLLAGERTIPDLTYDAQYVLEISLGLALRPLVSRVIADVDEIAFRTGSETNLNHACSRLRAPRPSLRRD